MSEEIAVYNAGAIAPANNVKLATDVAGLCKSIVTATAQNIQGRKYVRVEGWQAIATAHGCVASARDVEAIEGGIRAIGEVRRMDTGNIICTAEGFLGTDEETWNKRPLYARRAMCQTRAISRACRSAFAHVVVMMNAGLETTPAEEVPHDGFADAKPVSGSAANTTPPARTAPTSTPRPTALEDTVSEAEIRLLYARAKEAGADPTRVPEVLATEFPYLKNAVGAVHLLALKCEHYPLAQTICGSIKPVATAPAAPAAAPAGGFREFWPEQEITQQTTIVVATIAAVNEPRKSEKTGKFGPFKIDVTFAEDGVLFTVDTFDTTLADICKASGDAMREVAFDETVNGRFTNRKLVGVR
jgi:hypothetical protein